MDARAARPQPAPASPNPFNYESIANFALAPNWQEQLDDSEKLHNEESKEDQQYSKNESNLSKAQLQTQKIKLVQ